MAYPCRVTVDEAVGQNLHMTMWRRGIPQTRLAERLGVTQGTLSRKLRGKSPWTLDEVYAAAAALGCDPKELLPHLDSNQKPFDLRLAS
jgi:transcriptional regulator with XRE-family HTH domain